MEIVYFVRRESDQTIKIGTTKNIEERIRFLMRRYGRMTPIGYIAGYFDEEEKLHKKFKHLRLGKSEFFSPMCELIDYIFSEALPLEVDYTPLREPIACKPISLKVTKEMHKELKRLSQSNGATLSGFVRKVLADRLSDENIDVNWIVEWGGDTQSKAT